MLNELEIAKDFLSSLCSEDVAALRNGANIHFEIAVMREIRNRYQLWYDHPLTEQWRTNEATRDIRKGVDCSADHPDAVSSRIYSELRKLVQPENG